MMQIHQPTGILANYVEAIVYSEYAAAHAIERLIPDGSVNLIIELAETPQYIFDNQQLTQKTKFTGTWLSGMQLNYLTISAGNQRMLVVRFRPVGAYAILHLPVQELNNQVIDAELVLGKEIEVLRDQLLNVPHVTHKFSIINHWLAQRIRETSIAEAVVQYAVEQTRLHPTQTTIQEVMAKTGYSHRHFIKLFKQQVGLAPKQYQRIVRFNKVLQAIEQPQALDWSSISHDCGYYDQAHFIKEFKAFSGFNPKKFLDNRGEYIHYVPLELV